MADGGNMVSRDVEEEVVKSHSADRRSRNFYLVQPGGPVSVPHKYIFFLIRVYSRMRASSPWRVYLNIVTSTYLRRQRP
jgi:hypothetical protein